MFGYVCEKLYNMKGLHLNIVQAVITGLEQIFDENKYADKAIEKLLRSNPKWGSRDRKFIAETIYEVVRWHRLLRYVLNPATETASHWHTLGAWFVISGQAYPAWKEFDGINTLQIKEAYANAKTVRALRESIPEWMDVMLTTELGAKVWEKELACLNNQASVVLRANTLKKPIKHLQNDLATAGDVVTYTLPQFPEALVLERRQNIFQLPQFQNGHFEVQDAGSQLIAPFLKVEEGMRVIDACAGAGGKSLHLAALMQNKGKLIAMDVEEWKLEELKKRAKRGGISNIETRAIEGTKTIKRLEESADRLLLDVPCSGLGVLRRNPDAKWKLSAEFIASVKKTQAEILDSYCRMLKVGGQMVYATCSLLPSENRNQVDTFLANHAGKFKFIEDRSVMPSEGFDGFYMARMQRVG